MKKHILCILLALCMVLTLAPTTAFAERIEDFECTVSDTGVTIIRYYGSGGAVEIPDTIAGKPVTSIGSDAFSGCESLTEITLPDSLKDIGSRAFNRCTSLKSVNISKSVTSIYYTAFDNCTSLESFTVDENNTAYSSADGVLFNKDQTILMQYPQGNTNTSYRIPGSVTSIELEAFSNCANLESIHIPESVTSIGYKAFFGCTSLKSVNIPKSVTSIRNSAFSDCDSLESVTFGEGSQITSIGDNAFYNCTSLTSIDIPESVTSIGTYAFRNCASLTSIDIPRGVTSIEASAFYLCTGLTSINIPDGVISIGSNAFYQCTGLTSIEIPDSVTSIGTWAFYGCTGLESIFLPDKDTLSIGKEAIPDTASQVKYRLDESNSEVTVAVITDITLGTDKESVALPATICGYPVVAISDKSLLTKISSHTCTGGQATCVAKATCGICGEAYGELADHTFSGNTCTVCGYTLYPPTVEDTEDGTVTVSPTNPAEGETVTVTATPDEGYAVNEVIVTDKNGNPVEVTDNGDGTYSFIQPAADVTIKVVFKDTTVVPFTDVPADEYYYNAVQWAVKNGITYGTSDTTFSPNAPCTRAQMVTFLWRAAGCPTPNGSEMPFKDVVKGSYYETAVLWAVENGITYGTGATTFSPDATCNRAQFATLLWRSQGKPDAGTANPFTDVAEGTYYTDAVLWAAENGITEGTSATTFSPYGDCTRAQTVTFLYRCLSGK